MRRALRSWVRRIGAALVALSLFAVGLYAGFTGPRDLERYPPPAASPYRLPWPAGTTRFCVQGNRAVVSHRGWEEYAYDFTMPVGSPVCAARAGETVKVVVDHDGHGIRRPNNLVCIRHDDGTLGWYLHLRKGGSRVRVGERVAQGQAIAESGHVGRSMLPHLHFHVTDAQREHTLPIVFADVPGDGIPRMLGYYTAGTAGPPMQAASLETTSTR